MNTTIRINSEDIDLVVKNLIESKIKQFLRNDDSMGELIEEILERELNKRISKELIVTTMNERVDKKVTSFLSVPDAQHLIYTKISQSIKEMMERMTKDTHEEDMSRILKEEIAEIKKKKQSKVKVSSN